MAQLVSDFIITPVLRQARRFSSGFAADEPPAIESPAIRRRRAQSTGFPGAAGTAILEGDEHGRLTAGNAVLPHRIRQVRDPAGRSFSSSPNGLRSTPENPGLPGLSLPNNTGLDNQPDAPATPEASTQAAWPPPESNRATPLPEDDGMGDLRRRIQAVQSLDVAQDAKAQMMHELLTEKYTKLQRSPAAGHSTLRPVSRASTSTPDNHEHTDPAGPLQALKKWNPLGDAPGRLNLPLTEEDLTPTFVPEKRPGDGAEWWSVAEQPDDESRRLGCEHYRRNVKLQCALCERWYTCRHCHDAVEDHTLPRQQTKHMLCMLCGCAQKASDTCIKCNQSAAYYYCGICKLWNDDASKPIYHCSDCGLCRVGQGLGKDFFHCKKCMACISTSESNHKCIERAVDSDCPICNEYLFNSPKSVTFMQCGHSIHLACLEELKKTSYRCPLCNKSCVNMEYRFRQLDMQILHQPMPPDYADSRAVISCNDCSAKSQTAYHWIGLKCAVCNSYNTTQLQLLNMPGGGDAAAEQQQQQQQ
ncbi:zinc-ribbon-domain-containing protein, partial [Chaetomium tenue]